MKKIMIALAAIAMAVASQAAVVNWNSGKIIDSTGVAPTANAITAYLYTIDAATYTTYAAMDAATLSQTVGAAFVAGELGSAEASKSNTYTSRNGALANIAGKSEFNTGDTAYGLLLYVDAANEMYMANVGSATFASAIDKTVGNLAVNYNGAGAGSTAWAAVPEPTSGLLLLLGMAGLALKRKRA